MHTGRRYTTLFSDEADGALDLKAMLIKQRQLHCTAI